MSILKLFKEDKLFYKIGGFETINHIFSSRLGWDQKDLISDFQTSFNLQDKRLISLKQVHSTDIVIVDENLIPSGIEADGLVTDLEDVVLITYHADCVPLYFFDPLKKVIGLAHSGWKGSLNNIGGKMVKIMANNYDSNPEDIQVAIGPSICKSCYEVQSDVSSLFEKNHASSLLYDNNKTYLDLWDTNEKNFLQAGIKPSNINHAKYCTSCNNKELYSYRKENGTKGRMIAAITL